MNIVILAAGQGKRMHSNLPKVLHPLAGKALVSHVIDSARSLAPRSLCVVYGHGGDVVRRSLDAPDLAWALQEPQLGTGHAVQQALPHLSSEGTTLILYGDVPLIRAETLKQLVHAAQGALAILTVELADPTGYGRIVRDGSGRVLRIVEQKDSTAEERRIGEINTGIMAMPSAQLGQWLGRLSTTMRSRSTTSPTSSVWRSTPACRSVRSIRFMNGRCSASTARCSWRSSNALRNTVAPSN